MQWRDVDWQRIADNARALEQVASAVAVAVAAVKERERDLDLAMQQLDPQMERAQATIRAAVALRDELHQHFAFIRDARHGVVSWHDMKKRADLALRAVDCFLALHLPKAEVRDAVA